MTARDWTEMFPESCADYQRLNPEPDFDRLVARAVEMWTDLGEGGYPGKRMAETAAPLLIRDNERVRLIADRSVKAAKRRADLLRVPGVVRINPLPTRKYQRPIRVRDPNQQ